MTPTSSWPSSRAATILYGVPPTCQKESHILASNLDCAALVISLRDPATPTTFIDRFLATAEAYAIPAVIIINKADIYDADDMELAEAMKYLYESIGYRVTVVSALTRRGV